MPAALVAGKADVNLTDPENITPLLMAILNARFDTAKVLIEAGADVNRWDSWGRAPLYSAIDYNTTPRGGRPDRPSSDVTLPLEIATLLLDRGANPNMQLKLFPPYRSLGQDRGGDSLLTVGTTPLLRAAKACDNDGSEAAAGPRRAGGSAEQPGRHATDGGGRHRLDDGGYPRPVPQ